MLQAYRDEADAFTSTVGEREALPLAWWQARIADESGAPGLVVGAFSAERLVGAAGLTYERRERTSHKATLVGVYVHPEFRGRGAARALVRATLAQARAIGRDPSGPGGCRVSGADRRCGRTRCPAVDGEGHRQLPARQRAQGRAARAEPALSAGAVCR
jgi:GNAT superfamily N-acetyltransferase